MDIMLKTFGRISQNYGIYTSCVTQCSKLHLDDLKTVVGVRETTFH